MRGFLALANRLRGIIVKQRAFRFIMFIFILGFGFNALSRFVSATSVRTSFYLS
jgi:hypothetical protein